MTCSGSLVRSMARKPGSLAAAPGVPPVEPAGIFGLAGAGYVVKIESGVQAHRFPAIVW